MEELEFHGIRLPATEHSAMIDLERCLEKGIPLVKPDERAIFGFTSTDGHVTALYLVNQNLSTLPSTIGNLFSLCTLELQGNQLDTLPDTIGNLSALERLILDQNSLKSLPKSFENLVSLKHLSLRENRLMKFPENIENLQNLTRLDLTSNHIPELPESIGKLETLQILQLAENQLTSIPKSLGNLKSLRKFDLSKNTLSIARLDVNSPDQTLPKIIDQLTALQHLHIKSRKAFSKIPETIQAGIQAITARGCQVHYMTDFIFKTLVVGTFAPDAFQNPKLFPHYVLDVNPENIGMAPYLQSVDIGGCHCVLQLWVMPFLERYRPMYETYAMGSRGAILLLDDQDPHSPEVIEMWIGILQKVDPTIPLLIGETGKSSGIGDELVERLELPPSIQFDLQTGTNFDLLLKDIAYYELKKSFLENPGMFVGEFPAKP